MPFFESTMTSSCQSPLTAAGASTRIFREKGVLLFFDLAIPSVRAWIRFRVNCHSLASGAFSKRSMRSRSLSNFTKVASASRIIIQQHLFLYLVYRLGVGRDRGDCPPVTNSEENHSPRSATAALLLAPRNYPEDEGSVQLERR